MSELERLGFLHIYEANNNEYIQIVNFKKHQKPHVKEQASEIPGIEQVTTKVVASNDLGCYEPGLNPSPLTLNPYPLTTSQEKTGDTHAQSNQPARPENNQPDAGANPVAPPAKHDKAEPVGFELFWKNFPSQRKGSRDRALRAYRLALKRASAEKINLAVLQYAKSQEVRTGYAKGAAAWLNDDRYETDYSVNPKNGKRVETSRSESREVF